MTNTPKERLTIEQLRAEQVFTDLTPRQQKMIETFASSGDRIQAVLAAYNAKSPEVARVMAYEFFANPKVVACLTVYFQDDPLEVFKREVRRAYHNKNLSVAQVQAMKMFCDLNGWGAASLPDLHGRDADGEPETSKPQPVAPAVPGPTTNRFQVGDIATQDGERYRITAVDENGKPTAVDSLGPID